MYVNTVVVVGDRFDPAMLKPEDFFDGSVDAGRVVVGPIAQYSYCGGRCGFSLNPGRIDLAVRSPEVMPEELRAAAKNLVSTLDGIRVAVTVTGLGLNCDVALPRQRGVDLSNQMANLEVIKSITDASTSQVSTTTTYERGVLQYRLRIEPEAESQGRNLFVAVNGHQAVGSSDYLKPKLAQITAFREYVKDIHARIDDRLA